VFTVQVTVPTALTNQLWPLHQPACVLCSSCPVKPAEHSGRASGQLTTPSTLTTYTCTCSIHTGPLPHSQPTPVHAAFTLAPLLCNHVCTVHGALQIQTACTLSMCSRDYLENGQCRALNQYAIKGEGIYLKGVYLQVSMVSFPGPPHFLLLAVRKAGRAGTKSHVSMTNSHDDKLIFCMLFNRLYIQDLVYMKLPPTKCFSKYLLYKPPMFQFDYATLL